MILCWQMCVCKFLFYFCFVLYVTNLVFNIFRTPCIIVLDKKSHLLNSFLSRYLLPSLTVAYDLEILLQHYWNYSIFPLYFAIYITLQILARNIRCSTKSYTYLVYAVLNNWYRSLILWIVNICYQMINRYIQQIFMNIGTFL